MSIIFLTKSLPCAVDGSSTYICDILRYLKKNKVDFYVVAFDCNCYPPFILKFMPFKIKARGILQLGNFIVCYSPREWLRFFRYKLSYFHKSKLFFKKILYVFLKQAKLKIPTFADRKSVGNDFSLNESDINFIKRILKRLNPDTIIFNYAWTLNILRYFQNKNLKNKIVITHDALFMRHEMLLQKAVPNKAEIIFDKNTEKNLLSQADVIVAIQDEEQRIFQKMLPDKTCITVPMAIHRRRVKRYPKYGRVLLVGSGTDHNIAGAKWFIKEVWPKIKCTNVEVVVCGGLCEYLREYSCENIRLKGIVANLEQEYAKASLSIVPLLVGSGLKIKLMESLAFQCPVVSTPIGVQGINCPESYGIKVADCAEDFADAILNVLNEKESSSESSMHFGKFMHDFSPEACYNNLLKLIKKG